jgi:tRNA nucleotidyltransferase (CCA-adding enzyme)
MPNLETNLLDAVQRAGGSLYLVGGAVRDALLGRGGKDADYLVTGVALERLTSSLEPLMRVDLVGASFGVLKVTLEGETVDVALPRTERSTGAHHREFAVTSDPSLPIEADLARRDFTVNAIAKNVATGNLVDPFGGLADLENRVLRAVGDPIDRFTEDPLRMLRLARFVAKLGFTVEPATLEATRELAHLVGTVAPERIQWELRGLLESPFPDGILTALRLLRDTGLLTVILPEFAPCIGYDQRNPHHHLTLEEHIFQAVMHGAENNASSLARLALLLHDLGKPATQEIDERGVAHYIHHEARGAEVARGILERLRFSSEWTHSVVALVANHMRPPRDASSRALRRFKRDLGALWRDALEVRLADRLAHVLHGEQPLEDFKRLSAELEALPVALEGFEERDLALSGGELMQLLDLPPGPMVGQWKRRAAQAVVDGELENDPAAILAWVRAARGAEQS